VQAGPAGLHLLLENLEKRRRRHCWLLRMKRSSERQGRDEQSSANNGAAHGNLLVEGLD
jgi:hypothetical protein